MCPLEPVQMRASGAKGGGRVRKRCHSRLGLLNRRADTSRRRVKEADAVVVDEEAAACSKAAAPRGGPQGGARAEPGGRSKLLRNRRAPAGMARAAANSRKTAAMAGQPLAPAVKTVSRVEGAGADASAGRDDEGHAADGGMTEEHCGLYTREVTEPAGRLELATWLV